MPDAKTGDSEFGYLELELLIHSAKYSSFTSGAMESTQNADMSSAHVRSLHFIT
jgi:hypothetical protein